MKQESETFKQIRKALERSKELGLITEDEKQDIITASKEMYKKPEGRTKLAGEFIRGTEKAMLMTIKRNKKKKGKPNSLWIPKRFIERVRGSITVPDWYIARLKEENKL